jgi:tRNA/rRNA methyltransferase
VRTRFILIETSHAGNVGAAARALKVMGFDDLVLVRPRWANVLRREETIQRASGANDVLSNTRVVQSLDEAIDGVNMLCATAMVARDFGPPTLSPRACFELLLKEKLPVGGAPEESSFSSVENLPPSHPFPSPVGVAFLFGSERFGMKNEDVYRCNVALQIPTNPQFGSLNLASAVQVIAYEWRMALGGFAASTVQSASGSALVEKSPAKAVESSARADAAQVAGMLQHWQQALVHVGYLDPSAPKKLMPRLQQLFGRAGLSEEEIHILRGVAKAMLETNGPRPR